jgi:hypothetical protein
MLIPKASISQEIMEEVIDHLHHDAYSLSTLALVSKSWLPRSQFHLFEELYLSRTNISHFLAMLDSPNATIPPYVQ